MPDDDAAARSPAPAPPAPTLMSFFTNQRKGGLHDELSDALAEAVTAARDHGKKATISLTIEVKPTNTGVFEITDTVRTKIPTATARPSLWFADAAGGLHRSDPNQLQMSYPRPAAVPPAAAADGA